MFSDQTNSGEPSKTLTDLADVNNNSISIAIAASSKVKKKFKLSKKVKHSLKNKVRAKKETVNYAFFILAEQFSV